MSHLLRICQAFIILSFALILGIAHAVYVEPNRVKVVPTGTAGYDANTGLYTYTFTFCSDLSSAQEVESVVILLGDSSAINAIAPKGWRSFPWKDGVQELPGNKIQFGTIEVGQLPPNYVDDGNLVPSIYQIKPGNCLGGFSFQSPDPSGSGYFYAQGFTPIPDIDDLPDYDALGTSPPGYFDPSESYRSSTKVPIYSGAVFSGNRKGDGFVTFKNIANLDTRTAPVQIDIEFGINGETVDQNTFKAYLNSEDVTTDFKVTGPKTRSAIFPYDHLSLVPGGRNTLLTTVRGVVSAKGATAGVVDRIVFTVTP